MYKMEKNKSNPKQWYVKCKHHVKTEQKIFTCEIIFGKK